MVLTAANQRGFQSSRQEPALQPILNDLQLDLSLGTLDRPESVATAREV